LCENRQQTSQRYNAVKTIGLKMLTFMRIKHLFCTLLFYIMEVLEFWAFFFLDLEGVLYAPINWLEKKI
jgi:hypothetical protein